MAERFQFNRGNGWTTGQPDFDPVWNNVEDELKFHRGDEFVIIQDADVGPKRPLREIEHFLQPKVTQSALDTVFEVQSLSDGYRIRFRRHQVSPDKGLQVLGHAADLRGTSYVYGSTDCSWLTMTCLGYEGINLPHNSRAQFADPQVIQIPQAKAKPGDLLLIHNGDHVAFYRDPKTVWDTEPHDAPAPGGGMQGVGVQIRSTNPNYYCSVSNWDAVGRITAINGSP